MSSLRPRVFSAQSWQIIFGSLLRLWVCVCVWYFAVYFVTLSILFSIFIIFLKIYSLYPWGTVLVSRLDFSGYFFAKAKSGDNFLVHKICWTAAQGCQLTGFGGFWGEVFTARKYFKKYIYKNMQLIGFTSNWLRITLKLTSFEMFVFI